MAGRPTQGGEAGAFGGDAGEATQAGAAGAGDPPPLTECGASTPLTTNVERCASGNLHRPLATACPTEPRDDALGFGGSAGIDDCEDTLGCRLVRDDCTLDTDCGDDEYCIRSTVPSSDERVDIEHRCLAACRTDADCAQGQLCACETVQRNSTRGRIELGFCRTANCSVDDDCGPGHLCQARQVITSDRRLSSWREWSFYCQDERDECAVPQDCPPLVRDDECSTAVRVCEYSLANERWECAAEPAGGWDDSC